MFFLSFCMENIFSIIIIAFHILAAKFCIIILNVVLL